ncbi:MAG: hypothetical protein NVS9B8_14420 [Candidatus Limnocylindrales bacterium]
MFTNQDFLERIEDAERIDPFCAFCGQPTSVTERDRALWIECPTYGHRRSRLQSLLRFTFASLHTRRPIVGLDAAA